MKRCAYLTMADPGDYVTDYQLSFGPMSALGWEVETVAWRDPSVGWDDYDAVYICAPWDYPQHPEEFLRVVETIDRSSAELVNPLPLVRWTLVKSYLRDLEARGAVVVPTLTVPVFDRSLVGSWFEALDADTLVVKPDVGANAKDTYVLERPVPADLATELARVFADRPVLVQPFVARIRTEGEFSLIFFDGEFSHAIQKTPRSGDFRVQEEHGATIIRADPSPDLMATAGAVLGLVEPRPVYARVDLVRGTDGRFWLMELEMIEPSLYLRTDAGAPARFARALDSYARDRSADRRRNLIPDLR